MMQMRVLALIAGALQGASLGAVVELDEVLLGDFGKVETELCGGSCYIPQDVTELALQFKAAFRANFAEPKCWYFNVGKFSGILIIENIVIPKRLANVLTELAGFAL